MSLHFIQQFNIAKLVPVGGGTTTFAVLAEQCGLPEADVRRLLRHAMTIRVFDEPHEDEVVHTRASMLIRDEGIHGWIGSTCQNMWPGATRVSPPFASNDPSTIMMLILRIMHIDNRIVETVSRLFRSFSIGESLPFMPLSMKIGGWEKSTEATKPSYTSSSVSCVFGKGRHYTEDGQVVLFIYSCHAGN